MTMGCVWAAQALVIGMLVGQSTSRPSELPKGSVSCHERYGKVIDSATAGLIEARDVLTEEYGKARTTEFFKSTELRTLEKSIKKKFEELRKDNSNEKLRSELQSLLQKKFELEKALQLNKDLTAIADQIEEVNQKIGNEVSQLLIVDKECSNSKQKFMQRFDNRWIEKSKHKNRGNRAP